MESEKVAQLLAAYLTGSNVVAASIGFDPARIDMADVVLAEALKVIDQALSDKEQTR